MNILFRLYTHVDATLNANLHCVFPQIASSNHKQNFRKKFLNLNYFLFNCLKHDICHVTSAAFIIYVKPILCLEKRFYLQGCRECFPSSRCEAANLTQVIAVFFDTPLSMENSPQSSLYL